MCALLSVRVLRNLNLAVVGRLPGLVFSVSIITSNLFQHVRTLHTCPHAHIRNGKALHSFQNDSVAFSAKASVFITSHTIALLTAWLEPE